MTGHAIPFVAIDNPNPRPSTRARANLTLVRVDGNVPGWEDTVEALKAVIESEALRVYNDLKQADPSVMITTPVSYNIDEIGEALRRLSEIGYLCAPSNGWDRIAITLPADKLS